MNDHSFNRRVKPMANAPIDETPGRALVALVLWAILTALLVCL